MAAEGLPPREAPGGTVARNTIWLSAATAGSFVLSLATSVLVPRLLDPAVFGLWRTLQTVLQYTAHGHLGVLNAFGREGPGLREGNRAAYEATAANVLAVVGLVAAVGLVACVAVAFGWIGGGEAALAVAALGLLIVSQQFFAWADFCLMVSKKFGLKSTALSLLSIGRTVFMLAALWAFGFLAMLLSIVVVQLAVTAWMIRAGGVQLRPQWEPERLRRLLAIGFPMFCLVFAETLLVTTDKLVTVTMLGLEAMGAYGIASIVTPLVLLIPQSLRQVVSMEVFGKCAATGDVRPVAALYDRSVRALSLGTPLLCGACFLGADWGVQNILPKYVEGLGALKILSLGMLPLAVAQVCFDVLVAARRLTFAIGVTAGVGLINGAITAGAATLGSATLEFIALVHGVGFFVLSSVLLWRCHALTHGGPGNGSATFVARAWLTPACAAAVCIAIDVLVPQGAGDAPLVDDTLRLLLRLTLFALAMSPALIGLARMGGLRALRGAR